MCIESKLIPIASVHTECTLTAISQSTSMGGLKPVSYQIAAIASSFYRWVFYCVCHYNCTISKSSEKTIFKETDKYFGRGQLP